MEFASDVKIRPHDFRLRSYLLGDIVICRTSHHISSPEGIQGGEAFVRLSTPLECCFFSHVRRVLVHFLVVSVESELFCVTSLLLSITFIAFDVTFFSHHYLNQLSR